MSEATVFFRVKQDKLVEALRAVHPYVEGDTKVSLNAGGKLRELEPVTLCGSDNIALLPKEEGVAADVTATTAPAAPETSPETPTAKKKRAPRGSLPPRTAPKLTRDDVLNAVSSFGANGASDAELCGKLGLGSRQGVGMRVIAAKLLREERLQKLEDRYYLGSAALRVQTPLNGSAAPLYA